MKHVSIEILQKCPNNCLHCSSESGINCNDYIIGLEKIKKVFDGLSKLKVGQVSISGGEPFLHKDLVEMVKYGKDKNFEICIYTSGIMLDKNNKYISLDEDIIKQLKEAGVDKLIFNLQSLKKDKYKEIMGIKEETLDLLKESIKLSKKNDIYTELHFVPMKKNYEEIEDVIKFVKDENLDRVSFLGLIPHGRAKVNIEKLYLDKNINSKVKELLASYESDKVRVGIPLQMKKQKCICNAVSEKLYIKFDGTVYGCEAFKYYSLFDENGKMIYPDNINNNDDIEYIYNNSKYLKASFKEKELILKEDIYENCPIQEECREKGIGIFHDNNKKDI